MELAGIGGGGVMGFWSHLGMWLSGIGGGRGCHRILEPPGDLAVGYTWCHGILELPEDLAVGYRWGVMGFWSHLGIWLSGIGGRRGREEEEKESGGNQTTPP